MFQDDFAILINSDPSINLYADGGIHHKAIPTDEDGNVEWDKNYIAWDCNMQENSRTLEGTISLMKFNVLVVIMSGSSEDTVDDLAFLVNDLLTNRGSTEITRIVFEGENKYNDQSEGDNGVYTSELMFTAIY